MNPLRRHLCQHYHDYHINHNYDYGHDKHQASTAEVFPFVLEGGHPGMIIVGMIAIVMIIVVTTIIITIVIK